VVLLVVVDNLHLLRPSLGPTETDAVLLIDANGVLAAPIAAERFQAIAGRRTKIAEHGRRVEVLQFANCDSQELRGTDPSRAAVLRPWKTSAVPALRNEMITADRSHACG
jgi:hypothetical protein